MVNLHKKEWYLTELLHIRAKFATLLLSIKQDLPFEEQQRYEWSIPDTPMFEDLLKACIQKKA